MKNNLYENFEERELRKIQAECDRYGYHAFLQFDEIHIRTKGEEWYFVPANIHGGMITLMHRSSGIQDKYHRQFQRRLSYEQLIDYVHEHEQYCQCYLGNQKTYLIQNTGKLLYESSKERRTFPWLKL